jgi:hypothetical protein
LPDVEIDMEKHCGTLERVGDLTGGELYVPVDRNGNVQVGSFRAATQVDMIKIGSTVLKKPRVEDDLFAHLIPGSEACLYVIRMGRSPVLIGVKYPDGSKFLITKTYLRGSMLQLATIFAFMYGLGGMFVGGFLGTVVGGGETLGGALAMLGGLGGAAWCWYTAFQFWKAHSEAKAD